MKKFSLKQMAELVWMNSKLSLKSEASVNYLSYAWWIIEPLMHMLVYYVVFSFLLSRGGPDYLAFLLSGLIPWLWFAKSINRSQGSILQGKQLINQLYIDKMFFPLSCVFQDLLKQVVIFVIFLCFLILFGVDVNFYWLLFAPLIILQLFLIVSISLMSAIIVPFLRDVSYIIPTGLQFMMFCSGIFFSHEDVPQEYHAVFFSNPMAVMIKSFRDVLLFERVPDVGLIMYVLFFSVTLFLLSIVLYKKLDRKLPRVVLQ